MIDEQKVGYRKMTTAIVGALVALAIFLVPSQAEKIGQAGDMILRIIGMLIDAGIIATFQIQNVRQKVQLAQVAIEQTKADAEYVIAEAKAETIKAKGTGISLIKDRIDAIHTLIEGSKQAMWDYLKGALGARLEAQLQHMLDVNPNLGTIEAVRKLAEQFFHVVISEKDCAEINAYLGLPAVIHSATDIDILASFEQLDKANRLPEYIGKGFLFAALQWSAMDIINEATIRLKANVDDVEKRTTILQEFGLTNLQAEKTIVDGKVIRYIWNGMQYTPFNQYVLVGAPELEAWAANY